MCHIRSTAGGGLPVARCGSGARDTLLAQPSCASKASLRRTGVHCSSGLIDPCSRRGYVKSLRSSYMGLYPQRGTCLLQRKRRGCLVPLLFEHLVSTGLGLSVQGLVSGFRFQGSGFESRVSNFGFSSGFRGSGFGTRVSGFEFEYCGFPPCGALAQTPSFSPKPGLKSSCAETLLSRSGFKVCTAVQRTWRI